MSKSSFLISLIAVLFVMGSCSSAKQSKSVRYVPLAGDSILLNAHTGLLVLDPATGNKIFGYQESKYFVPASNTKIVTCYVAMKYFGDSLKALRWVDADTAIIIYPTGDPTFLHPDFKTQTVVDFLKSVSKPVYISTAGWDTKVYGKGWNWDDFSDDYMPERSIFPVYGNTIRWHQAISKKENPQTAADTIDRFIYSDPEINWPVEFGKPDLSGSLTVRRDQFSNSFTINEGGIKEVYRDVPFITNGTATAIELLKDTIHRELRLLPETEKSFSNSGKSLQTIHSVPSDSMLKAMMYNSDNFFAEQALLMAALEQSGKMNETDMIRKVLANDLAGFPQTPTWVDGSGLSRYNLFSPEDMVWLLSKMKNEYGAARINAIFPTAGSGTLKLYSPVLKNKLFAKTGSLTGVNALSGYLITASGKTLVFSFMINNHRQTGASIRKKMDEFLVDIYNRY